MSSTEATNSPSRRILSRNKAPPIADDESHSGRLKSAPLSINPKQQNSSFTSLVSAAASKEIKDSK
jgi:hypothetical protein